MNSDEKMREIVMVDSSRNEGLMRVYLYPIFFQGFPPIQLFAFYLLAHLRVIPMIILIFRLPESEGVPCSLLGQCVHNGSRVDIQCLISRDRFKNLKYM